MIELRANPYSMPDCKHVVGECVCQVCWCTVCNRAIGQIVEGNNRPDVCPSWECVKKREQKEKKRISAGGIETISPPPREA